MMKGNLLLWVGLITALPCFAGTLKLHPSHGYAAAHRIQPLEKYESLYSASLLTPVSIDRIAYNSWRMNFESEEFDIIRFASGFNSEGHEAILNFILEQMEKGGSSDLIDRPLVVPVWVSWGLKFSFNDWTWASQHSLQKAGEVTADSPFTFKVRDGDNDFSSEFYCPIPYKPPHMNNSSPLSKGHLLYQSEPEYTDNAKLPPMPYPVPPPLPRFFVIFQMSDGDVVKISDAKLPPMPYPVPPPLPRFFVVFQMSDGDVVKISDAKLPPMPYPVPPPLPRFSVAEMNQGNVNLVNDGSAGVFEANNENGEVSVSFPVKSGDVNRFSLVSWGPSSTSAPLSAWSVISNEAIQGEIRHLKLYFVVVSFVSPEKRELFRGLLEELQLQRQEVVDTSSIPPLRPSPTHARDYYMNMGDWYDGVEACELMRGIIMETAG